MNLYHFLHFFSVGLMWSSCRWFLVLCLPLSSILRVSILDFTESCGPSVCTWSLYQCYLSFVWCRMQRCEFFFWVACVHSYHTIRCQFISCNISLYLLVLISDGWAIYSALRICIRHCKIFGLCPLDPSGIFELPCYTSSYHTFLIWN